MDIFDGRIPPFKYFPTDLMDQQGPRLWARIRLLQACKRLKLPRQLWPELDVFITPLHYGYSHRTQGLFSIPEYFPMYESEAEWKARAHVALDTFMEPHARLYREQFRQSLRQNKLTKIPQTRDTTPLDLRYDWAAKRYCLNLPYRRLVQGGFNEDRIKKAVIAILKEAGLREGK